MQHQTLKLSLSVASVVESCLGALLPVLAVAGSALRQLHVGVTHWQVAVQSAKPERDTGHRRLSGGALRAKRTSS